MSDRENTHHIKRALFYTILYQNSPMLCQKSPISCIVFYHNSPVLHQKSPILYYIYHNSPMLCQKSPIFSIVFDIRGRRTTHHIIRALYHAISYHNSPMLCQKSPILRIVFWNTWSENHTPFSYFVSLTVHKCICHSHRCICHSHKCICHSLTT